MQGPKGCGATLPHSSQLPSSFLTGFHMACSLQIGLHHSHQIPVTLQRCQPNHVRLSAGRRTPGGSSTNTKGRLGPERKAPRRAGPPTSAPPSIETSNADGEQVEVPSVGWMWQAGNSAPASSRPMPSAVSTVANLYEDRIKAKKSLGQNFLTDDGVLLDLVVAAGVGPGDLVLEVGPGTGNLTKHLLAQGARVTAVEKDDTLYGRLQREYCDVSELTLVHGDALKVGLEDVIRGMMEQDRQAAVPEREEGDAASPSAVAAAAAVGSASEEREASSPPPVAAEASSLSAGSMSQAYAVAAAAAAAASSSSSRGPGRAVAGGRGRGGGRKVKVVANLPYNITKDLLQQLLPLGDLISDLHIMIQHEAAVRLTEHTPGGPEWRAANIRTLFYCKPRYRFRISRFKYNPVPGVDGALVTFSLLPPGHRPVVPSERGFHSLVLKAFSERRKKMRNSLQPLYSSEQVEAALVRCALSADARAQDLTLEQFVAFSWQLHRGAVDEGMALLQGGPQAADEQPEEADTPPA